MLEEVLFGGLTMPGELVRLVVAFAGTLVAAYFDLYNKKNVPDQFLYGFLGAAFLINLVFYEENLFLFSIGMAVFISAVAYVFYRVGQLGGADIFILASVMLLLPIHPSFTEMTFNIPFVFSLLVFSGVLFALYVILFFGWKLYQTEAKPKLAYALLLIPYLLFAYIYVNSFLFSPMYFAFLTIALFATVFFMMFKESLLMLLSEELPVTQLEPEDVLSLEIMNPDMVRRYKIPRLMTKETIEHLKKSNITDVWVYTKLPPFIPFILAGMVFAILFAKHLLLL